MRRNKATVLCGAVVSSAIVMPCGAPAMPGRESDDTQVIA
ncbi:hypothetical protein HMPREF1861_01911 [Corynebacterium kroppenstedtii]|nr:hypothetical protein HMPREF1861_01911 [Corynebacterium kroppenstedtii]